MNISSLVKGLIQQGTSSIAVAKKDDVVYRIDPIPEVTEITFVGFTANETKTFNLNRHLAHDYQVVAISLVVTDDATFQGGRGEQQTTIPSSQMTLNILREDKVIDTRIAGIKTSFASTNQLVINHNDIWTIETDKDVDSITIRCTPLILNQPITLS